MRKTDKNGVDREEGGRTARNAQLEKQKIYNNDREKVEFFPELFRHLVYV